ncbi:hypothetical protein AB0L74_29010 [Streptomyces sp. NPDC052020]|uniref:hypothetical protein n=1 Tax=Streptomyces sp. NPDC052020 TaxID=3155677 RepID=UPI003429E602
MKQTTVSPSFRRVDVPSGFGRVVVIGGCGAIGADFVTAIAPFFDISVIDRDVEQVTLWRDRWAQRPALNVKDVSCSYESVRGSDVVVITIGTEGPEGVTRGSLFELVEQIASLLTDSQLVVLRTTADPGTTRRLTSILDTIAPSELDVVVAPERSLEGAVERELFSIPQLLGGPARAVDRAEQFFNTMGIDVIRLPDWESAELAKLICNGYRYMSFQLANHFEMLASEYDCSYEVIRRAVRQDYPRTYGLSAAGFVGGPCLPKDTRMLSDATPDGMLDLAATATAISDEYEAWVADRIERRFTGLRERTIGVLGMGFKARSQDRRASRSIWLAERLAAGGATIVELDDVEQARTIPMDCLVDVFGMTETGYLPTTRAGTPAAVYVVGVGWRSDPGSRHE